MASASLPALANGHHGATTTDEETTKKPITILVTGFGPFQDRYPVNPSYEIAQTLPHLLPIGTSKSSPAVEIIPYASPIRVCYKSARELIPSLLESHAQTVDMVLHIGMASGRKYYSAERYGHRDGYITNRDLDGQIPPDDEPEVRFGDCPRKMGTSLDFEDVVQRWRESIEQAPDESPANGADCRSSEDAGRFLCDYTYFNSLAWYARRHKKFECGKATDRPVLFLHVPAESDEVMLDRGRAVTVALIRAMVDSYVEGLK
jgi:pyroglutamyl-peptidase